MDDTAGVPPSPTGPDSPGATAAGAHLETLPSQGRVRERAAPRKTGRRLATGCLASLSWLARVAMLALLVLGALLSLIPSGRAALRGTLLVPAVLLPNKTTPLTATGDAVRHSTLVVTARSGPVYLDIYEPVDAAPPLPGAREGVVVIPGIGDERKDSQLINLATSLAREGIVVMDLTTPALIARRLDPDDVDAVVQAFLALAHHPGVGVGRAGILGISGGGDLGMLAAADSRIRDQLGFMMLFGGYYDAKSLLRDFGQRALDVDGTLEPWTPNPVPVEALAKTIAPTLPASEGKLLVGALSEHGKPLTPAQLARLSPGALAAYHLLQGDDPTHVDANIAALTPAMQADLVALSPSAVLGDIHAPIYLLHDRNDTYVPFTESRAFAAALVKANHPHDFVELNIFAHVEVKYGQGFGPLVGDGVRLFGILTELLEHAS
jgi:dienelactone hydrolase